MAVFLDLKPAEIIALRGLLGEPVPVTFQGRMHLTAKMETLFQEIKPGEPLCLPTVGESSDVWIAREMNQKTHFSLPAEIVDKISRYDRDNARVAFATHHWKSPPTRETIALLARHFRNLRKTAQRDIKP